MSSRIHNDFVSSAPPAPDAESLAAVRAMAKERARRGQKAAGFRSLLTAGPFVLAIAVMAAVALGVTLHGEDAAFANSRAVAALMPQGGVLHAVWELTTTSADVPEQKIVGEDWVDAEVQRARSSMRSDGEDLNGIILTISQGDHVRGLDRDVANDEYSIVEYELPFDSNARFSGYVELLVEGLESGDSRVVDQTTIDGESYWVVEAETAEERVSALLRVEDYQLKDLALYRPDNGKWVQEVHFSFSVWETVSRESLPSDFFEPAEIDKAMPAGTSVRVEPGSGQ